MTLIYKINDLERKIPYKQWEALKKEFVEFAKEKKQLEANWNELKEWLKANDIHYAEAIPFRETLRKMQELEGGSNE